jgi:2-polyprenyl-6-methoxyphenol hydroxylase-like FAD-dependent oxidoreductase
VTQTAIIIGGGIAGLSAGIALRDAGWDIEVYEQAPALTAMGAALSLWPNAVDAMDRLGCGEAFRAIAPRLDHFGIGLSSGQTVTLQTVSDIAPGRTAYLPSRTQLQSVLAGRLGGDVVRLGHVLKDFNAGVQHVEARFENGHVARGDLLIAADGIWSRIALATTGGVPRHAGYGGLLGMCPPLEHYPDTATGIEYWGRGMRMGVFDHGDAGKYWFYMRNEPDGPAAQNLTTTDVARALAAWPAALRDVVAATPAANVTPFSVHAKPPPRRLGVGRIICVGDAAHAMEPNLGQGACQALEDAVALGTAAKGVNAMHVLPAFEQARLKRVRMFVSVSAQGGLIAHRFPSLLPLLGWTPIKKLAAMAIRLRLPALYGVSNVTPYSKH